MFVTAFNLVGDKMSVNKFAIDFGSAWTNIYKVGSGLVLSEPTVVATSEKEGFAVKAIGHEASKLIGKAGKDTKIIFPIFEGEVVNVNVASQLLAGFLEKVGYKSRFGGAFALFSVPCGVTAEMLNKYRQVAKNCGIGKVYFVESPILSALGQRIPFTESTPCFVIDMAGGTTNIATLSLDGIIAGVSVNFGSNKISADIIDFLAEKHGLQIGLQTAEKLKREIGSLDKDDELYSVVNGRDVRTGSPKSISIKACDIIEPVKMYFDKIAEIALSVLKKLPPEVSAEINNSGIYVSGGASSVYALNEYYEEKFKFKINVAENGLMSVALGGGVVIANQELLKKLALDC